jgi:alpha-amylase
VADRCYLPANRLMLDLITRYKGKFRLAYSISGVALEQFAMYAPDVLDSFKALAETGAVEFLAETYPHSLISLRDRSLFEEQVQHHARLIEHHFGQQPHVFRNTELIYSDEIGDWVSDMGYQAMLTEGARHVLGWKSPNFLYVNAINPRLKVLLRNYRMSDDLAFRFPNTHWNEYPLTAEKFTGWLKSLETDDFCNLFMDYEAFGEHQPAETGIFHFMEKLPEVVLKQTKMTFCTPTEIISKFQPVSVISVPHAISWADEERDLSAWLGNELQDEAYTKLYELAGFMKNIHEPELVKDWNYLQSSDHFYYMCTKFFSDGEVHRRFNPFESPYEAFINYMNVLNDFHIRVIQYAETNRIKEPPAEPIGKTVVKHQKTAPEIIGTGSKKIKKTTTTVPESNTKTGLLR